MFFFFYQAFFDEERGELAKKRQKIRLVQQRKVIDMTSLCRDLPDLIPMPLVIGTKVTARLRHPQVRFLKKKKTDVVVESVVIYVCYLS